MSKAKIPVSINGLEFDALITEDKTLEATVPEYTVEDGRAVSDDIILSPLRLSMLLFVTNTPVTWLHRHGASNSRVTSVVKELEQLYYSATPVTIVTSDAVYRDMAIESITISKSVEVGYSREIPISFKKINIAIAKTTTIPDSYGKSGLTEESAGLANVSSKKSGKDAEKGETKSSILYNASKALGILK